MAKRISMMFLNALSQVDLKNWKVFFIGTVETHDCLFQREIDGFFEKNPSMREQFVLLVQSIIKKNCMNIITRLSICSYSII